VRRIKNPLRFLAQKAEKRKGHELPVKSERLSHERQHEMLDSLVRKIVDLRLEVPAMFFLETYKPVSTIASDLALASGIPLVLELFGVSGYEWTTFFGKRENVDQLVKRIEKINEEKLKGKRC